MVSKLPGAVFDPDTFMTTTTDPDIIHVSHTSLHPDTLRRVVEEFVTRSGTD